MASGFPLVLLIAEKVAQSGACSTTDGGAFAGLTRLVSDDRPDGGPECPANRGTALGMAHVRTAPGTGGAATNAEHEDNCKTGKTNPHGKPPFFRTPCDLIVY
jgi:hypothetical protein